MNALTLTTAGQTRIANALLRGLPLTAVSMAVGSSPASVLTPASVGLGNELLRLSVTGVTTGNQIAFSATVPAELGPYTLNEVGLYDDSGTMIAFGPLPTIYKPAIVDGFTVAVTIIATLVFSATTPATVIVPAGSLADSQIYTTPNGTKVKLVINDDFTVTPTPL